MSACARALKRAGAAKVLVLTLARVVRPLAGDNIWLSAKGAFESRFMSKVKIYTTPICPYCVRAKALLKKKGATFDEVDVFMDADARQEMEDMTNGARTVPQIFIGEKHVGGCDELYALESEGQLDRLLKAR